MLVPPERTAILGRALWKPRYVVLGSGALPKSQNVFNELKTASRILHSTVTVDVIQQPKDEGLYISIFKTKGDWEFVARYPVSAFTSCEIQSITHRKQGPSLETLVLGTSLS